MVSPSDCSMGARIGFAIIGIIIGLAVAVVFGVEYHNYNASVWGLISGVAAAVTLYVHVAFLKGWYAADASPLRTLMYAGCFTQLAGCCSLVSYLVLALVQKQGVVVYGPGFYIAAVWGFMTLKWGFQLFYFSRAYWRILSGDGDRLVKPEKGVQAINYGVGGC